MVLANFITFTVFKILYNLVSMQKSLFGKQNYESKITKSIYVTQPLFLLDFQKYVTVLSKYVHYLRQKNVASFVKTHFY